MESQTSFPDYPRISAEETRNLLVLAKQGDSSARDRLISGNLRLVVSIVNRFRDRGFEFDDLFQVGSIGLVKAIDGFDLSYDVQFSTYAVPKIIGEIKRFIREARPVKVSRSYQQLARQAAAAKEELWLETGQEPNISEIASRLGVAREDLVAALDSVAPVQSLQQVVYESESDSLQLEDQIGEEAVNESLIALKQALQSLEPEDRRLVLLRYFAEKSQTEVAAALGISQAQVSRIEKRILSEMRKRL